MRMWLWYNQLIRVHKSKIEQQNQSNHTRFHIRVALPFPSSYVLTQEPRPVLMVLDLQGPLVTPDVQFWACCVEISTKKSLPTYLRTYTEVLTTYQVKVYILVAFLSIYEPAPLGCKQQNFETNFEFSVVILSVQTKQPTFALQSVDFTKKASMQNLKCLTCTLKNLRRMLLVTASERSRILMRMQTTIFEMQLSSFQSWFVMSKSRRPTSPYTLFLHQK